MRGAMQKYFRLIIMLLALFSTLSEVEATPIWRRAYAWARTPWNNFWNKSASQQRYITNGARSLNETEEKLLDRVRTAVGQKDWQTVEQTRKFIEARYPRSPLIEMIDEEVFSKQRNMNAQAEAPKDNASFKQGASKTYQKTSEPKKEETAGARAPNVGDLSGETANIQTRVNKAKEVLHNKHATLEELSRETDEMMKLLTILQGFDALKNKESASTNIVRSIWIDLHDRKENYRAPSEAVGNIYQTILQQEKELDKLLAELKSVASLFEDPRVPMMEKIKAAHDTAKKALAISKDIESNKTWHIPNIFKTGLNNPDNLSKLVSQLDNLYDGLRAMKEYKEKRYEEKSLIEALQDILYDIQPSLGLLSNPQAPIEEIWKLYYIKLVTAHRIARALQAVQDFKKGPSTWSFNMSGNEMAPNIDIGKLCQRADHLHDGLKISKGENIYDVFKQRKSTIKNILTVFNDKKVTLKDIESATQSARDLMYLSYAVDSLKNQDESDETKKIRSLWHRLYQIQQTLKELEGKSFYDLLSSSRSDIAQSISELIVV